MNLFKESLELVHKNNNEGDYSENIAQEIDLKIQKQKK